MHTKTLPVIPANLAPDTLPVRKFIPNETELPKLQSAIRAIMHANKLEAQAKRAKDAAKLAITDWLQTEREFDLETLARGSSVIIEGAMTITIKGQTRFDDKALLAANPLLHANFLKEIKFPAFNSLISE